MTTSDPKPDDELREFAERLIRSCAKPDCKEYHSKYGVAQVDHRMTVDEDCASRLLAARDARRDAARWIRCEERMSPIGEPVLAVEHGRVQRECWIWTGARWDACVDTGYEDKIVAERGTITHWQPLPEPPESER